MPRIFLPVSTLKNNAFLLRESPGDAAGPFALDSPMKPQELPPKDDHPDNHGVVPEADNDNSSTTTEGSIGRDSPDLIGPAPRRLCLENDLDESRKDASSLKHDSGNTSGNYGTDKIWGAHAIPSPPAKRLKYYDAEDPPSQIERVTPRSRHTYNTGDQTMPVSCGMRSTEEIKHVAPELEAGSSPTNVHLAESTSILPTLPTDRAENKHDASTGQLVSRFSQLQPEIRSPYSRVIGCPNVQGTTVHRPDGVSVTRNGASSLNTGEDYIALDLDTAGEQDPITHGTIPMVSRPDSLDDEQGRRRKLSQRKQAIGETNDGGEQFALEFNSQQLGLTLATAKPAEVGIAVDRVVGDDSDGSIVVVCDVDMATVVASGAERPLSKVRVGDRIVAVGGETAIGLDLSDVERRIVRGPRPLEIVFQRGARDLPKNANKNDGNTHYDHSNMTSNACNPPRQTGEHSDGGASSSNTTKTSKQDGAAPAVGWRAPLGGLEKPSQDCLLDIISAIATREDFLQDSQAVRDPEENVEPRTATQEEGLPGAVDVPHTLAETSASHGIEAYGTKQILGAPVQLASDGGQGGPAASHSGVYASAEKNPVTSTTATTSNPTSLLSSTGVDARVERAPAAGLPPPTATALVSSRDGQDRFPDIVGRRSTTVADSDADGIRETLGTGTGRDGPTPGTWLPSPAAPPGGSGANSPPVTTVATGSVQAAIASLTQTPKESSDQAKAGEGKSIGTNGEAARGKSAKRVRGATTVASISRKNKAGAPVSSGLATAKAVPEASIPTADEVTRILNKLGPKGMSEIGLYKNLTFDELSRVCRYAGVDLSKRLPKDTMAERLNSLHVEKGTLTNELQQKRPRIPTSTNGTRSAFMAPQSRANLTSPVTAQELSTPTSITQSPSTLPSSPARTRPPAPVPQRPPRSPPLAASSLAIPSGFRRPPSPLPPAASAMVNQSDAPYSVVDFSSPACLSPTSAPGISREAPSVPTSGVVEVPERDDWENWEYQENVPRRRRGGSREEEEERSWWLEQESDDQWSTCSSPPMPQQVSPENAGTSQAVASAVGIGEGERVGNPPPVRRNPLLPVVSSRRPTVVGSNEPALFVPSSRDGAPSSSRGSFFGRGFAVLPRFLLRSIRTIGTQAPLF